MSSYIGNTEQPKTNITKTLHLNNAKRGIIRTKRTSFEITPELEEAIDKAIYMHQAKTGKRISKSAVIRQALSEYLYKQL